MPWIIVFLTLIEFSSAKLASIGIYWNASNPIFRIDNTDHIIDVNRGNNPFEYDQVNIICPTYTEGSKEEAETYIIYNVSKEEYDTCRITNSNPRIIAICDNPLQLKYFTITFRSFTPQPGGLEFKPGKDYYFVTTSTGKREGLDRRFGGRCSTHHMKVIFKVCCSDSITSDNNNTSGNNNNNKTSSNHQLSIESSSQSTIVSSTISTTTHFPPHHVTSPSHLISTLSPSSSSSSSSSSSYQSLNKEPLFNDWTSLLGSFSDNSNTLTGGIVSSSLTSTTTSTSVPVSVPVSSLPSFFSSTLFPPHPPPSSSSSSSSSHPVASSTIPAASEHWWKPHFTRIENLKWRSKSPGNNNVVKSTGQFHPGKGDTGNTNDSNASSRNTLQPIAWTVFAISCFIFIIFWALWYKVKRNNVMLPMSK